MVQTTNNAQSARAIYIGHIGEIHYVSTCLVSSAPAATEKGTQMSEDADTDSDSVKRGSNAIMTECSDVTTASEHYVNTEISSVISKTSKSSNFQSRAAYMRQYRATKQTKDHKTKLNAHVRNYRVSTASREKKTKYNEYKINYRASKASAEEKAKHNVYKRNYRAPNASEEEKAKHSSYVII